MRKMGVAYDSLVQVVTIAGVAAIIFLIISFVSRYRTPPKERGLFKKMPLLLPAFAFISALLLSYMYVPFPISGYRGANTGEIRISYEPQATFYVYDAEAIYYSRIDIRVQQYLQTDYSLQVNVWIYESLTLVDTAILNLYPPSTPRLVEDVESVSVSPGRYNITAECLFYVDGELEEDTPFVTVQLAQPTRPEMVEELVDWSSYQFFLNIGCIAFLMFGLCIGSEERTRRRVTEYDEEPRRDGEVYGRKY